MSVRAAELAWLAEQCGLLSPSIVLERLDGSGAETALERDRPLSPASMIKVPLAAAVCGLAETGAFSLDAHFEVKPSNITANDADSPLAPGYRTTPRELIRLAVSRSDNVATNELIDLAGRARANALLHRLGLHATSIRRKLSGADPLIDDPGSTGRNAHPAGDAATLLRLLAREEIAGARLILDALEAQIWNGKLSRGWRAGDRYAHKTGDTSEVSHDGGILQTRAGALYVVVVYTSLVSSPANDEKFGAFAAALRPRL